MGCIWNKFVAELALKHMGMESVKAYIIGWLDWGANYVKDDPEDFFSKCEHHYSPLINLSRMQAYRNYVLMFIQFISGYRQITILG